MWEEGSDRLFIQRLAVLSTAPPPASLSFPPVLRELMFDRFRQSRLIRDSVGRIIKRIDPETPIDLRVR
jgi:hypothetical protein